jgi:hypothetical protein
MLADSIQMKKSRSNRESTFYKAFDAGRKAVKDRRTPLLLLTLAFMAVGATVHECYEHNYIRTYVPQWPQCSFLL